MPDIGRDRIAQDGFLHRRLVGEAGEAAAAQGLPLPGQVGPDPVEGRGSGGEQRVDHRDLLRGHFGEGGGCHLPLAG